MKMKRLSEDHYIIMDDSEIKEGDWYLCWESKSGVSTDCTIDNTFSHWIVGADNYKKITHSTQPLDKSLFFTDRVWGCERLSLGEVKELIGVGDVEKNANKQWGNVHRTGVLGYIEGYNQALRDNKENKYTEEDLVDAINMARNEPDMSGNAIIKSLQPQTEWEVKFVDGKLKLKQ